MRFQRLAGNGNELIVIDREIRAIAIGSAEGSDAENVGDEFEAGAVPGPDHGTRTGEALGFFVFVSLVRDLFDLILDETVRPCDANGIGGWIAADVERDRHAFV